MQFHLHVLLANVLNMDDLENGNLSILTGNSSVYQ